MNNEIKEPITRTKLKQYYYLELEIEELYHSFREISKYKSINLTGMPGTHTISNPSLDFMVKQENLAETICSKIDELVELRKQIEDFINSLDDIEIRVIIRLRSLHSMSWQQIARKIKKTDESYPRKKYNKFFDKLELEIMEEELRRRNEAHI